MMTKIWLAVFAALPMAASAAELPAERQFDAWLAAFNGGDRAVIERFLRESYPSRASEKEVERMLDFRNHTGGFDSRKAEETTATRFVALVQDRGAGQFARAVVEVESDEPHRITTLELRLVPPPAELAPARSSEAELVTALGARLDADAKADQFAGAVLVARADKPVFATAYGYADREKKLENKLATRFRIGSMNKMFTATAILQLVEAGKIKLEDPVGKYLVDYPNKEVAARVTIHHLLSHTGGTGDIFGPAFDAHRLELRTLADYVKLYGARPPAFPPGARWEYSNYGFVLLGVIVEKVSGMDYYDYIHEKIYRPAGMTASGSQPEAESVPDRSIGYVKAEGHWRPNTDTLPYRGTSAGGGYSTVEDLLRFANALTGNRLLGPRFTDLLTTGKVDAPGGKYAYGFGEATLGGIRSFGHGGGAPGMNGELKILPQSGYVVAVLANMDPPAASRVADFIAARLPAP